MPANEKTWYDMKSMHAVFAVSALVMLGTTLWMLADDHRREWKQVQREFRGVKSRVTTFRMDEQRTETFAERERELESKLLAAEGGTVSPELYESFKDAVSQAAKESEIATPEFGPLDALYDEITAAEDNDTRRKLRAKFFEDLQGYIDDAARVATNTSDRRKEATGQYDAVRSRLNLAIDRNATDMEVTEWQHTVDVHKAEVDELTIQEQQSATYQANLERIVKNMKADEAAAAKALADHRATLTQLEETLKKVRAGRAFGSYLDRLPLPEGFGRILERPIIEGFNSPIEIKQLWLPDLTINYNFSDVARFDRCITCHLAIKETAPGTADQPGYEHLHPVTVLLPTPEESPVAVAASQQGDPEGNEAGLEGSEAAKVGAEDVAEAEPAALDVNNEDEVNRLLKDSYGLRLASEAESNGTALISVVWPGSVAARAGLEANDVIVQIGEVRTYDRRLAITYLLDSADWGQPLKVQVHRGFAHPFATHPRLDLFVGDGSPHKMQEMGCTICHDGQGSATTFKFASHTPNSVAQQKEWQEEHGWFDNHHWIFPMYPKRFAESSCLKCHHEVVALEPSEQFPQPPAPKLVKGFRLVERLGCYGCHEINGYNGDRSIGPDLRREPPYARAAQDLLIDKGLTDHEREMAEELADHPENDSLRHRLVELIKFDANNATSEDAEEEAHLSARSHHLASVLEDVESPGQLRKVGPSLRYVASKLDSTFIYDWVKNPLEFRPSTKMPRFYGLLEHLPKGSEARAQVERFEPVEIRSVMEYLLAVSQPFEYITPPSSVTTQPSAERGKKLFEVRGCLACHQHRDFPEAAEAVKNEVHAYNKRGPNLSDLGSKLTGETGHKWLYSWLKQPTHYNVRTLMPNLKLDPITEEDGTVTDPAADIAAYLLSQADRPQPAIPELDPAALDELTLEHLRATFTRRQAERYLAEGIPESLAGEIKGDEIELIGPITQEKKLMYVGRRTLSRRGCTGCHDIPGFEDTKPIGTALADWGRKDPARLAFEHIVVFLEATNADRAVTVPSYGAEHGGAGDGESSSHGHGIDLESLAPDTRYFVESILSHKREGFLWQKLRQPRSYDYEVTENKLYIEQLRMPQFTLTDDDVETLMTFILGLVSEPPADQYVYKPNERQLAINEGHQVLEKFNCGGCHTLDMPRWEVSYDSEAMQNYGPGEFTDFPFLEPHFTPEQIAASASPDRRGLGHTTLHGRLAVDDTGTVIQDEDFDGNPANFFTLWKSSVVAGMPWAVGDADVTIALGAARADAKYPERGGFLARYLYPRIFEMGYKPASPPEVWGWLPPPLLREGKKVQTAWLHDFLLAPHQIRPAVLLQMPKFNMTSAEASTLVRYFAAVDDAQYPYELDTRTTTAHLAAEEARHPNRLDDALKIVTNNDYCVKCHLVGDYRPQGQPQALAPQLANVHNRLRPEFLRNWIANPKRLLPYTGMPQNFPPDVTKAPAPGQALTPVQKIYPGSSVDHIDAVVDLLLNYDRLMEGKTSIKATVKPPAPAEGEPAN